MEESNEMALATFKVLTSKWEKFKAISKSKGKTASFILNEFIDQTIAAEENLPPKTSPDKFITHEDIAPLVARIEALEKGSGIVQIVDPPIGTEKYKPPFDSPFEKKDEPNITSEDGKSIPEPTPPVDESKKTCFDLVGTVSEVAEVPSQKEQIPEIPEQKPDISESTISEVPDTIPEPTEFSQKTIDEVLDSRGDAPEKPWFDKNGFDTQVEEHQRFALRQWVDLSTIAEIYDYAYQDVDDLLILEEFQKDVKTVPCSDGNLYRWIGETSNGRIGGEET